MIGHTSVVGSLLREWRGLRRMSQLDLAIAAEVSPRHLSFVETGRAVPSREMVLTLARALEVPVRERNTMLTAAGYAPLYRETSLDDPRMAEMRHALGLLLKQNDPFFAVALDRRWDIVMCNAAYSRLVAPVARLEPYEVLPPPRLNLLKALFGPFRPLVVNWEEAARDVFERAQREAAADRDPARRQVLAECLALAPEEWRRPRSEASPRLVVTVDLRLGEARARLFSTITTLGTAQDITLQELHIESFHPADAETEALLRQMAVSG
ncbi:MAG: helix-turn-helix domain-containing protein [Myxococcales bacterium]